MIARLWSARTTPLLSSAYLNHFDQAVHPQLRKLDGFLGACVAMRSQNAAIEILVTTYWASFAAIDAFAAPDRECAVVADEAATLLTDFDRRVRHYDIAFAAFPSASILPTPTQTKSCHPEASGF